MPNPIETDRIRAAINECLNARAATASICPSEVARHLYSKDDWREQMPIIRQVARDMADEGALQMTQGGKPIDPENFKGPIRLRRPDR